MSGKRYLLQIPQLTTGNTFAAATKQERYFTLKTAMNIKMVSTMQLYIRTISAYAKNGLRNPFLI